MARLSLSRVWPAATFQFCFVAAMAMVKPGANALTLSRFSSSALPYLYILAAVIAGGLAMWGGDGRRRRQPSYLAWVGALMSLALAFALRGDVPWAPLLAYLFAEAFATQTSLSFWGAVSDAFDAREARRAFSWINGVGMSGAIVGGLSAQTLAQRAGAVALLAAGGVLLMVAAVLWRFHRVQHEVTLRRPAQTPPRAQWQAMLRAPYIRLLGALVLGLALLQQFTDYLFRERAAQQLAETDMAGLFAAHQLWTGIFCVVFQLLLAEVLLRRLGILHYAALIPLTLAVLTVVAWVVPTVWGAFALKVFEAASSWSLMPVALQLLYAPLSDGVRDGARRSIDGIVRKAGMIAAGFLILGLAPLLGVGGVFGLSLVVCVAIGAVLWVIRPRYVAAIHERVAGEDALSTIATDERLLGEALSSPSAEQALRAADLLERAGRLRESHVRALLTHREERVQQRGVMLADARRLDGLSKPLEFIIANGSRRPRNAAIWALARLAPDRARLVLPPLLEQTDIGVVTAAVGGLLSLQGPVDVLARGMLDGLIRRGPDAPAAERREVARLLGRLGPLGLSGALKGYLDDSDVSVRKVAVEAAGEGRYLDLVPRLMRSLAWREERRAARAALAHLGDPAVPLLAAALDDRTRPLSLRLQLPRVLRVIGTQAVFDALLYSNAEDDPSLHYRVGVALSALHDEQPALRVDLNRLREALRRQRAVATHLGTAFRDCRAALGEASLLTRVLGDRLDQSMELSFWLLGLRGDARALRRAHSLLLGVDSRRRAWAIEFLEHVLTAEERALVSHHFEAHHRSPSVADPSHVPAHLSGLCESDDFSLKACARYVARRVGLWAHPYREDDMNEMAVKRLFALEGVEIFAQSDVDDLAAVAAVAREQTFAKGSRVYAEGDPGDALYVIIDGAMEARRDGEVVLTMSAKESFGETSLFDGAPRINEVIATADSRVLVIDRRDFLDLLGDRPELLAGMFRVLSQQLKSMVVEVANRRSITGDLLVTDSKS